MLEVKGIDNESIVLDGDWVEKLRMGQSRGRVPASSFQEATIKETSRRKFVVFGEKEELVQLVLRFDTGIGLIAPAEKRPEMERLVQEIEKAKAGGGV